MTNQELQKLVEEVSVTSFHLPFLHQATFNRRLKTTGGRYHLKSHDLDFNPRVMEQYDEAILIQVIKHELCHYHLHLRKKGYRHQDRDFKNLLQQVGGARFAPPLVRGNEKLYRCQQCGQQIKRQRKINTARFVCGKCGGKLLLEKETPGTK